MVEAVSGTERSCVAGEGGSFEGRPVSVATSWASVGSHVDGWTGEGIFFFVRNTQRAPYTDRRLNEPNQSSTTRREPGGSSSRT